LAVPKRRRSPQHPLSSCTFLPLFVYKRKTQTQNQIRGKERKDLGVLFYFIFNLKQERRLSSSNGLLFLSSLSLERQIEIGVAAAADVKEATRETGVFLDNADNIVPYIN